ncbi:MAG: dihydroxyacetone kinase subunit L [Methylococcales symbiont of Hymedesmia sp. n. MRB-2018]|nr:MAG: dihydroxyacetone kinase subunit L [Methylococcales symbiont of Hymedesmia sp. n. MRB-2018]
MQFKTDLMPALIEAIDKTIQENAEQVTTLDQILGDGDHVINLQRGLNALKKNHHDYPQQIWSEAWQKTGMTLLSTMGGASGSLFGTFFISMSKSSKNDATLNQKTFSEAYIQAVEAVKKRGKSKAGEKTMLDVLIPVSELLQKNINLPDDLSTLLDEIATTATNGMESTREMLATKGRASYLQEKSIGHIDAGAKTNQLIICAIAKELKKHL